MSHCNSYIIYWRRKHLTIWPPNQMPLWRALLNCLIIRPQNTLRRYVIWRWDAIWSAMHIFWNCAAMKASQSLFYIVRAFHGGRRTAQRFSVWHIMRLHWKIATRSNSTHSCSILTKVEAHGRSLSEKAEKQILLRRSGGPRRHCSPKQRFRLQSLRQPWQYCITSRQIYHSRPHCHLSGQLPPMPLSRGSYSSKADDAVLRNTTRDTGEIEQHARGKFTDTPETPSMDFAQCITILLPSTRQYPHTCHSRAVPPVSNHPVHMRVTRQTGPFLTGLRNNLQVESNFYGWGNDNLRADDLSTRWKCFRNEAKRLIY